jgi:ATP-dependent DNA ligase
LKDKIKRRQKDVTQKEAKQIRVQFLLFDIVALDGLSNVILMQ